jgi:hypothetical protein
MLCDASLDCFEAEEVAVSELAPGGGDADRSLLDEEDGGLSVSSGASCSSFEPLSPASSWQDLEGSIHQAALAEDTRELLVRFFGPGAAAGADDGADAAADGPGLPALRVRLVLEDAARGGGDGARVRVVLSHRRQAAEVGLWSSWIAQVWNGPSESTLNNYQPIVYLLLAISTNNTHRPTRIHPPGRHRRDRGCRRRPARAPRRRPQAQRRQSRPPAVQPGRPPEGPAVAAARPARAGRRPPGGLPLDRRRQRRVAGPPRPQRRRRRRRLWLVAARPAAGGGERVRRGAGGWRRAAGVCKLRALRRRARGRVLRHV